MLNTKLKPNYLKVTGQFNLYAKIGPEVDGGIILSGHTDVVPTEGQNWITNPFKLVKKINFLEEVLAI